LFSAAELRHHAEQDVKRAMRGLTPLQVEVVRCRILSESPETLAAMAERHGLSRESIRQQEIKAMRHLRYWLKPRP
jgi:DNA-directed RNA polymerase sigma subunit (sigma70/sigma32)